MTDTFDHRDTVVSQYSNSPIMLALIDSFSDAVDQGSDFDAFYNLIWNVLTAQGYGLDLWGRIVGVVRVLQLPSSGKYFGFEEATGLTVDPFNQSPFYSGATLTNNFSLTDAAFRTLILAKALANISDGSIPGINQVLLSLFPGRGNCYVTDAQDMTMTYTFLFALTAVEIAIVSQSGVLPKPVGVQATVIHS